MTFSNRCCISLDDISKEDSYLIKIPAPGAPTKCCPCTLFNFSPSRTWKKEKNIYYYISNETILNQLTECPQSRRKEAYYAIKLADLSAEQLSQLLAEPNTLVDDLQQLDKLTVHFPWKKRAFKRENAHHRFFYNVIVNFLNNAVDNAQQHGMPYFD